MSKLPLSIVVPVYNEHDNITAFLSRLQPVVEAVSEGDYEIVFVDDGSSDGTARLITEMQTHDHHVKLRWPLVLLLQQAKRL
jgi:glycosyltransferase involved in cell wall biosynthesis